jgi:glycerate kinase
VHVVVAPDGFGGTLAPTAAARAIAEGWASARPTDRITVVPMSDGGQGLLDVLAAADPEATSERLEVAGPDARPRPATLLRLGDGTVVIESADVCGLALVPPELRRPLEATTYGIGQALAVAVAAGARRIVVGLGGTAALDGGSGALNGLGLRLRTADGALRIGAGDLAACVAVERGRAVWSEDVELVLLHDVDLPLAAAAPRFGPQKGLDADGVARAAAALEAWAGVLGAAFPAMTDPSAPGTGAAGGLGLGLAAALGGRLVPGAAWVGDRVGLDAAIGAADLVITGEGRLDAASGEGKVVGHVAALARARSRPLAAVVGGVGPGADDVVPVGRRELGPVGPDGDAAAAVRTAAATLARRLTSVH